MKLNTTVIAEANTAEAGLTLSQGGGTVKEAYAPSFIGPRVTNYPRCGVGVFRSSTSGDSQTSGANYLARDADFPTAQITDLVIRGLCVSAANLGCDELHVYTQAIS